MSGDESSARERSRSKGIRTLQTREAEPGSGLYFQGLDPVLTADNDLATSFDQPHLKVRKLTLVPLVLRFRARVLFC